MITSFIIYILLRGGGVSSVTFRIIWRTSVNIIWRTNHTRSRRRQPSVPRSVLTSDRLQRSLINYNSLAYMAFRVRVVKFAPILNSVVCLLLLPCLLADSALSCAL